MKTKTMLLIANGYVLKAQALGLVFLYIKNRDEENVKDRAPRGDFVLYVIRRTERQLERSSYVTMGSNI